MATVSLRPDHWHSSNMALSSGRLVMSIISPRAGKGTPDCWKTKVSSLLCTGTYYTRHQAPRAQRHIWTVPVVRAKANGRHFSRSTYKFYGAWWPRVASWRCFRGFVVYRNSCSTSLACLFSDWTRFSRKKSCFFWVDWNPTLASVSYLATLLWRKDDDDSFSPKLRVRIKDNNNSPHGKFHQFLFPFSSKFSDLNFTSYVLYIFLYYITCHTQWAWVTYAPTREEKLSLLQKINYTLPQF